MPTIDPEDFFAIYREWQWIKHRIFSDYLWPWANKLGSIAAQIYVVDAFAGAGAYRVGTELREGSPLIEAKRARAYLRAVLAEFAEYYNRDRPHRSLGLASPLPSRVQTHGRVVSRPILGGLHHVYARAA